MGECSICFYLTWNEYNRPNIHGPCSLPNGAFLLASGQKVKDNTPVFISSGFSWPFGYLSGKAIQPAKQPDHDSSAIRWSPRSSCRHRDSSQWNHGEKVLIMSHATFWRSQSWLDPQHHKSTLNGYLAEFTGKPLDTVGNHYAKFTLFAVFLNAYQSSTKVKQKKIYMELLMTLHKKNHTLTIFITPQQHAITTNLRL